MSLPVAVAQVVLRTLVMNVFICALQPYDCSILFLFFSHENYSPTSLKDLFCVLIFA